MDESLEDEQNLTCMQGGGGLFLHLVLEKTFKSLWVLAITLFADARSHVVQF